MIKCPLCAGACFPSVLTLLKHVRITHADSPNFCFPCGLQGCKRTFKSFHTLKSHIHAFHDVHGMDTEYPDLAGSSEDQPTLENDYPVFGQLKDIYVIDGSNIVFQVRVLQTSSFSRHHHAYLVDKTPIYKLINISDVYHPFPFFIRHLRVDHCARHVIIPKYHICGTTE